MRSRTQLILCLSIYVALAVVGNAQNGATGDVARPVLISDANSGRAVALESVVSTPEAFSVNPLQSPFGSIAYASDSRTRITLFARNLILQPGEDASAVTADAEDNARRHYGLRVEYVGKVAGQEWMSQIILRFNDNLGETGDVLVGINYRGVASNRVRLGLGRIGGGGPPDDNPFYVLDYDGTPQTVDYGPFWPENVSLGKFYWEFWAMPGENAYSRYLLSDGYGGAHALLFGFFAGANPDRYSLYGNIYTGASTATFNSDDGPAPGEWGHFAVGWDGRHIITYYNGVPVGRTAFAGPRMTPGPASGGGRLYIGGSDHNNLIGKIAQVRGYEGISTLEQVLGTKRATSAFTPDTFFGIHSNNGGLACSFLSNFFRPGSSVPDLANGRVGVLRGGTEIFTPSTNHLAQFIVDPVAPSAPTFGAPAVLIDNPNSAPRGARIFDSFSRRSVTYAFNGTGGLGSTEGGSSGSVAWRFGGPNERTYGPPVFGILNGRAVILSDNTGIAWLPTGSSTGNLDMRVDRHPGSAGSGIQTGLCFRVKDGANFFFAYTGESEIDPFNTGTLTVGYWLDGVRTNLVAGMAMPNDWSTLRVVTMNEGRISIYANDTLVYSTNNAMLATETGAGLYNDLYGLALTNRWDNFTVLDAPSN